jgi:hypothetical protein
MRPPNNAPAKPSLPHLHGAFFAPARTPGWHRLTRVPVKENKRHRCSGCWLHTHNASVVIVRPPFCFLSSSLCTCTHSHTGSRVIPAPSHDHNPALPRSGPRTPLRPFRTWPAATAPAITRAILPDHHHHHPRVHYCATSASTLCGSRRCRAILPDRGVLALARVVSTIRKSHRTRTESARPDPAGGCGRRRQSH